MPTDLPASAPASDDSEQPTVVDGIAGRGRSIAPASVDGGGRRPGQAEAPSSEALTASIAIREEQTARTRGLALGAVATCIFVLVGIHAPGTTAPGYVATHVALVAVIVVGTALVFSSRGRRFIDERWLVAFGLLCSAAVLSTVWLVGVFCPLIAAAFLLVFFYGLGHSRIAAWAVFVFCTLGYLVLTGLAIARSPIVMRAFMPMSGVDPRMMAIVAFGLEGYFVLVFWTARLSRRATLYAMERLEQAQRRTRQREALLNEARADLDRALEAGRIGRFTGIRIGAWVADEVIGRGGMGEVYEARHFETGEPAALKVLHRHLVDEAVNLERFFSANRAPRAVSTRRTSCACSKPATRRTARRIWRWSCSKATIWPRCYVTADGLSSTRWLSSSRKSPRAWPPPRMPASCTAISNRKTSSAWTARPAAPRPA